MYRAPRYSYVVLGDNNAICQRCQFQYKASELRKDGQNQGLWVCNKCWDARHPQDFVRAKPDDIVPAVTQPEPDDKFEGAPVSKQGDTPVNYEDVDGSSYQGSVSTGTFADQVGTGTVTEHSD